VALQQLNLKLPPALAADWRRRAAAEQMGLTAWVVAQVEGAGEPAGDGLLARVEALEAALLQEKAKIPGGPWVAAQAALDREVKVDASKGGRPSKTAGGPPVVSAEAQRGTRDNIRRRLERFAEDPAGAITTGELADHLGIRRPSFNARVSRAGGLRVGVEVSGWRCVGLQPADRGGPPRGLWVPAGTEVVPDAG